MSVMREKIQENGRFEDLLRSWPMRILRTRKCKRNVLLLLHVLLSKKYYIRVSRKKRYPVADILIAAIVSFARYILNLRVSLSLFSFFFPFPY